MIKTFTQDDVLRYLYNETNKSENREIEQALKEDYELRTFYEETKQILGWVNSAMLEPSERVIANVLKLA